MTTVFTIILLLVFSFVARLISPFALNFGGLPEALLAGDDGEASRGRFAIGVMIATVGQSFVYLAFVAFIVRWTQSAMNLRGAFMVVWPFALMAALTPVWFDLIAARIEHRECDHPNAQVEALHFTVLISFVAFFAFTIAPALVFDLYWWLPFAGWS